MCKVKVKFTHLSQYVCKTNLYFRTLNYNIFPLTQKNSITLPYNKKFQSEEYFQTSIQRRKLNTHTDQ